MKSRSYIPNLRNFRRLSQRLPLNDFNGLRVDFRNLRNNLTFSSNQYFP
jgi:hypothetical protein